MSWKRTAFSVGLGLAVLAVGLIFFSGHKRDVGDFEDELTTLEAKQTKLPEDAISIDCPDDEFKVEDGSKFDCAAEFKGKPVILSVEFTSDDGKYNVVARRAEAAPANN